MRQERATGTRRFLYDGDALVALYTASGALSARYVHGAGSGDDPLVWVANGENRRLHSDHQGSIVATASGTGTLQSINGYDEWGIPNMTAGAPANTGRFQYTGQIYLPDAGSTTPRPGCTDVRWQASRGSR